MRTDDFCAWHAVGYLITGATDEQLAAIVADAAGSPGNEELAWLARRARDEQGRRAISRRMNAVIPQAEAVAC